MQVTTEDLLKYSVRGAIVTMVNAENGTFFDGGEAGQLVISEPISVGGRRTEVELSIRRRVSKIDALPYAGKIAFRFNRLDVSGTLSGTLAGFYPPLPTSTRILLDEMTKRSGIVFEDDDFVLEDIIRSNAAPYVLKAKRESLRWIGQMEIPLLNLIDLQQLVRQGMGSQVPQLDQSRQLVAAEDNQPYLNATPLLERLDAILLNSPVVDTTHPLVDVVRGVVPELGQYLQSSPTPWDVRSGNSGYNLRGAMLVSRDVAADNANTINPALNLTATVRLAAADTMYLSKDIVIPYARLSFGSSDFDDAPRLTTSAVINASDATAWNAWVNSLQVGTLITSLPAGMDLRWSGPEQWVANAAAPSRTNLYGCGILYNGPRRGYDPSPYYNRCNRVLALAMSLSNTAYRGTYIIHYRAPIILNEVIPNIVAGVPFDFDFNPTEGQAPYTVRHVSGSLPPGLSIGSDNHLTGTVQVEGNYSFGVEVTDGRGVKVGYTYSTLSRIAPLVISGLPTAARIGQPYSFSFTVSGGVPPYDFNIASGSLGPGLSLPDLRQPTISGTPQAPAGTRTFIIEVNDARSVSATTNASLTVNS